MVYTDLDSAQYTEHVGYEYIGYLYTICQNKHNKNAGRWLKSQTY